MNIWPLSYINTSLPIKPDRWLQHSWHILIKLNHFRNFWGKIKNSLKPPPEKLYPKGFFHHQETRWLWHCASLETCDHLLWPQPRLTWCEMNILNLEDRVITPLPGVRYTVIPPVTHWLSARGPFWQRVNLHALGGKTPPKLYQVPFSFPSYFNMTTVSSDRFKKKLSALAETSSFW